MTPTCDCGFADVHDTDIPWPPSEPYTREQVLEHLTVVVERVGPDHGLGDGCRYLDGEVSTAYENNEIERVARTCPRCLIGFLLVRLNYPRSELATWNESSVSILLGGCSPNWRPRSPHFTKGALRVMRAAQREQDAALSWGEALVAAAVGVTHE